MFQVVPFMRNHRPNPPFPVLVGREFPTNLSPGQPSRNLAELDRVDVVHPASVIEEVASARDQSSIKQDSKLPRDRLPAQAQLAGDLGRAKHIQGEERHDSSPGWIGKQVDPVSVALWHDAKWWSSAIHSRSPAAFRPPVRQMIPIGPVVPLGRNDLESAQSSGLRGARNLGRVAVAQHVKSRVAL